MSDIILKAQGSPPYDFEPILSQEKIDEVLEEMDIFLAEFHASTEYNKVARRFEVTVPQQYVSKFLDYLGLADQDDGITYCPECQP